jgi:hypothetical protein
MVTASVFAACEAGDECYEFPTKSCVDEDGSNYYEKGSTKYNSLISSVIKGANDYCKDTATLIEYICDGSYLLKTEKFTCPSNMKCCGGACLKSLDDCLNFDYHLYDEKIPIKINVNTISDRKISIIIKKAGVLNIYKSHNLETKNGNINLDAIAPSELIDLIISLKGFGGKEIISKDYNSLPTDKQIDITLDKNEDGTDFECEENWECDKLRYEDWEKCDLITKTTIAYQKYCKDLHGCGTTNDKPSETQACTDISNLIDFPWTAKIENYKPGEPIQDEFFPGKYNLFYYCDKINICDLGSETTMSFCELKCPESTKGPVETARINNIFYCTCYYE